MYLIDLIWFATNYSVQLIGVKLANNIWLNPAALRWNSFQLVERMELELLKMLHVFDQLLRPPLMLLINTWIKGNERQRKFGSAVTQRPLCHSLPAAFEWTLWTVETAISSPICHSIWCYRRLKSARSIIINLIRL